MFDSYQKTDAIGRSFDSWFASQTYSNYVSYAEWLQRNYNLKIVWNNDIMMGIQGEEKDYVFFLLKYGDL